MAAIRPTRNSDVISATPPALLTASKIATTKTAAAAPANQIGTARVPAAASPPSITCPLSPCFLFGQTSRSPWHHYGSPVSALIQAPIADDARPGGTESVVPSALAQACSTIGLMRVVDRLQRQHPPVARCVWHIAH